MWHAGTTGVMIARAARLKLSPLGNPGGIAAARAAKCQDRRSWAILAGFKAPDFIIGGALVLAMNGLARAAGSSLVHPPGHGADAISPQGITALVRPIASGTGAMFAFLYSGLCCDHGESGPAERPLPA
jgi:hypothetical protein